MTKCKKAFFSLFLLAPVMIFLAGYLVFRSPGTCNLDALDAAALQEGDLVFRRGKSLESFAVVIAGSNQIYSHIGLLIMEGGKPFVIHIEPGESSLHNGTVKKEPLHSFLETGKATHFAIYRSHLCKGSLSRVIAQAKTFYLWKCSFDNAYDLQTDRTLYCTELVLKAYRQGDQCVNTLLLKLDDVNMLVARRQILMPGAFTTSSLFYKICSQ